MKVTDVRTTVVENLSLEVEGRVRYWGGRYLLFVEVETDEGITGLGERITGNTYSDRLGDLKSQIALIDEMARMHVIGQNPFNI